MKIIGIDAFGLGRAHYTGKENYILNLIKGLLTTSNDIKLFLFLPKNPNSMPKFSNNNIEIVFIGPSSSYTKWCQLFLPSIIRKVKPDIMIFSESMMPFARLPSNIKKILIIYDVMYLNIKNEFDRKTRILLDTLMPMSLKKADAIITISQASKSDIIHFYKCNEEKITVVVPSIEYRDFILTNDITKLLLNKYGIKSRYITYVGSHFIYKNLFRLVEAFKKLTSNSDLNDLLLLLIGKSDKNTPELIKKINQLEIQNRVVITRFLDNEERNALLKGSQLLILPSLYEGFGIPLIEAMALGVPVVTSNISSMPEVVGDAGLTFNPYKIDEMVLSMKTILLDNELKLKLIQKGKERVKLFNHEYSISKLNQIINNYLN